MDLKCPSRADERVISGRCVYRWKMPPCSRYNNQLALFEISACSHLLCIGSACMLASIHEQTQQMAYPSQCYSAHLHWIPVFPSRNSLSYGKSQSYGISKQACFQQPLNFQRTLQQLRKNPIRFAITFFSGFILPIFVHYCVDVVFHAQKQWH